MVSLTALWLPIVLSAVVVFIASSIIHMVFKYHNSEYGRLPDEAAILDDCVRVDGGTHRLPG